MGGATTSPWQNATPAQKNSTNNTTSTETWECPNCKKQVNGNFCPDCGAKKPEKAFCPNCGKKVDKDTKFCPDCGTKLN